VPVGETWRSKEKPGRRAGKAAIPSAREGRRPFRVGSPIQRLRTITLDGYAASHRAVRELKADGSLPADTKLRLGRCGNGRPHSRGIQLLSIGACDVDEEAEPSPARSSRSTATPTRRPWRSADSRLRRGSVQTSRLAAILSAEVAGYSRLIGQRSRAASAVDGSAFAAACDQAIARLRSSTSAKSRWRMKSRALRRASRQEQKCTRGRPGRGIASRRSAAAGAVGRRCLRLRCRRAPTPSLPHAGPLFDGWEGRIRTVPIDPGTLKP